MKKTNKIVSALAILSLIAACGKSDDNKSSSSSRQEQEETPLDGSNIDGHYQAKFVTMNPHVNGTIPGSANFFRQDDRLFAYVRLFAGGVRAWHMQYVYEGTRCPTMSDDANGDGFIDILEAEAVMGKVLIPFDSDISSQAAGKRFFPVADLSGYYHYERITNFRRFLDDLQKEDTDLEDNVTKLPPGAGLSFIGKVFMVYGVAETVDLPETVGTKERRRAFQTLPVACGTFQKVAAGPGTEYVQDEIPGPVAEVVPGQDRPADEIIPEPTTGGSSGGSTGGTNDSDDGDGPISDGDGNSPVTTGGSVGGTPGPTPGTGTPEGTTTGGSSGGGSDDTAPEQPEEDTDDDSNSDGTTGGLF